MNNGSVKDHVSEELGKVMLSGCKLQRDKNTQGNVWWIVSRG